MTDSHTTTKNVGPWLYEKQRAWTGMTDGTRVPLTVEDGRPSVADDLFTNNGNEDRKGCVELGMGQG